MVITEILKVKPHIFLDKFRSAILEIQVRNDLLSLDPSMETLSYFISTVDICGVDPAELNIWGIIVAEKLYESENPSREILKNLLLSLPPQRQGWAIRIISENRAKGLGRTITLPPLVEEIWASYWSDSNKRHEFLQPLTGVKIPARIGSKSHT